MVDGANLILSSELRAYVHTRASGFIVRKRISSTPEYCVFTLQC